VLTLAEVLSDFAAFAGLPDDGSVGIEAVNSDGATPLHWMATLGDSAGIQILANAGASLDAQDNLGNTPLHEAVANRQAQAVQSLLLAGAKPDCRNAQGFSARDLAAQDKHEPTLALFAGK
jgi:ankyrin repeat protein